MCIALAGKPGGLELPVLCVDCEGAVFCKTGPALRDSASCRSRTDEAVSDLRGF